MEWRPIPGFSRYKASDTGLIVRPLESKTSRRRNRFERLIQGSLLKNGYRLVKLVDDAGVGRQLNYHRVIAMTFHGKPPPGRYHAAHFDGDQSNNQASNLRWATVKENCADKLRHGTQHYGDAAHRAKLTSEEVIEIRHIYQSQSQDDKHSYMSQHALAHTYGVSQRAILNIIKNRTYING